MPSRKSLAYYRNRMFLDMLGREKKDIRAFGHFSKMYSPDVVFFDRTETIKTPIRMKNFFPLPKFRHLSKSYEEIVDERARELLQKAKNLNCKIYIMYSGGVDSTLVAVSFLKNATREELCNITVLLSEDSIRENPVFYRDYISKNFNMEPSDNFTRMLGTKNILVSGELNDQIFGADIIGLFCMKYGAQEVHKPYERNRLIEFYNSKTGENPLNARFVDLVEKSINQAPVKISTYFHFFWWINFTTKWQCVYFRSLPYVKEKNCKNIDWNYLDCYYQPFYGTEDFQLWSMNNLDKRMHDDWKSYKWPAKEVIYKFNKDEGYFKNKAKVASLPKATSEISSYNFIDEHLCFLHDIDMEEYYNSENDFV